MRVWSPGVWCRCRKRLAVVETGRGWRCDVCHAADRGDPAPKEKAA